MDLSGKLRERHEQAMRTNRIKLVAMLILLVALLVVMWELRSCERRGAGQEKASPGHKEPVEPLPTVDTETKASLPEGEAPDVAPLAPAKEAEPLPAPKEDPEKKFPGITDPKVLEQVLDQNGELEGGPFLHMLWRVSQDTPEKLRAEADTKVVWPTLWDSAEAWRGKALRVSGELVQMWEMTLPGNPTGLAKLHAYRLRADNPPPGSKGYLYDVFAMEKLKGARRYDRLSVYGRFFKARVSEAQKLDDPDFQVAVVVARAFERPDYLDQAAIPGPIVDGNRAEARPLYWLLKRARDTSFEDLKAQAEARAAELKEQTGAELGFNDFTLWPERYRAWPVIVRGELRRLIRHCLPENLLDMPDVFYGQFAGEERRMNTFYCIHVPVGIRHGDPIVLYGYFFKRWEYASEGRYQVTSPIFVAQRMRIIEYGDATPGRGLAFTLVAVVGVTALVLGAAIVLSRTRDRKAAEARRQRETERMRAKFHPPEEKPEEPKPPDQG
ncbi:MAG: hypothetical protein FJ290_00500 [Planctomycetes bacterium]|nr:hypothetical protein [Planctomycetota bacterium]